MKKEMWWLIVVLLILLSLYLTFGYPNPAGSANSMLGSKSYPQARPRQETTQPPVDVRASPDGAFHVISWTHRSSANEVHVYAPSYSPTVWHTAFTKTAPGQLLSVALAASEWSNGAPFVIEERWVAEDGEYIAIHQHVYHPQNTHLLLIRGNIAPAVVATDSRFGHRPRPPRRLPASLPALGGEGTEGAQLGENSKTHLYLCFGKPLTLLGGHFTQLQQQFGMLPLHSQVWNGRSQDRL